MRPPAFGLGRHARSTEGRRCTVAKSIYTFYKERLIEIGGNNRCLYLKNVVRRGAYDIGRIFEGRDDKVTELADFLWGRSRKQTLALLSGEESRAIIDNIEFSSVAQRSTQGTEPEAGAERSRERTRRSDETKILAAEVIKVKELWRDIEEIERETGRRELYIGYPFVFGCIPQGPSKTLIKAPLLLFPVKVEVVDEFNVDLVLNKSEQVHINHALIYAYAQSKKLNIDGLELEFDDISSTFNSVKEVIDYLARAGIKISGDLTKNVLNYGKFKEPETKPELSIRNAAVLARFPLANSIYADYTILEKQKLSNDALAELLRVGNKKEGFFSRLFGGKKKKKKRNAKRSHSYTVKMLDYAQSEVVRKVEECGNMVIYGPPGTGKSQTIVNIIADAMAKNKRVLVVSQKKAALDVVYNRLGLLTEKAMYITDESKEKRLFFERCSTAHTKNLEDSVIDVSAIEAQFHEIESKIAEEVKSLEAIRDTLYRPRMPVGLSLAEMYTSSYNISKNSPEYSIYSALIEHPEILELSYDRFSEAMFGINDMKLEDTYYDFMEQKEKNPLIDNMLPNLDLMTLSEVKTQLEAIARSRKGLFNTAKYPYYRQVLAFYPLMKNEKNLDSIVRLEASFGKHGFFSRGKVERQIKEKFIETLDAIESFAKEYDCLHKVLSEDGYLSVIDNVLRGNTSYVKLVHDALDNYISQRDIGSLLASIDDVKLSILNFAYSACRNHSNYVDILSKLMGIRIYHEVQKYENESQTELARIMDFENIAARIYKLKESELEISYKLASGKISKDYENIFDNAKNRQDYLYQITKNKKYWPIRRMLEEYSSFILALFPVWLLSPENVSSLLPLSKNMFDIVIFDEASQVFIENTIPTIYRGKTVVVAGDDKQLRPSAAFMKRYLGTDPETQDDYAVQAALEVDSLLDLAVARYESANLTYHYRSRSQELIDFSNAAFYSSGLQIAPNTSRDLVDPPIVRYKVEGKWINRKNRVEARKVVEILSDIFKNRKNNESIGIITFNSEQQSVIADMIDEECTKNDAFRSHMVAETHRTENGEDTGIFVKNLENVQGDERDIIIFSIGYAENENGKVYTSFGSLSADGGQNRLNVAITRAKRKIIVVTSIEPEDLKVEAAKNSGPKLLQKYLMYVRAVSEGKRDEVEAILSDLHTPEAKDEPHRLLRIDIARELKEKLEKQGYEADLALGAGTSRLSLAIYDKDTDRYLVGVEIDSDAYSATDSPIERDVFKPKFLEARGWTVVRIWCRDWWLSPAKVVRYLINIAEKNKKKLLPGAAPAKQKQEKGGKTGASAGAESTESTLSKDEAAEPTAPSSIEGSKQTRAIDGSEASQAENSDAAVAQSEAAN